MRVLNHWLSGMKLQVEAIELGVLGMLPMKIGDTSNMK
jgi:hypothetical protein